MSALLNTVLICEGEQVPPGDTDEEKEAAYFAAWQTLIDNGMAWSLQGWFGRTAMHFIECGHCTLPKDKGEEAEVTESVDQS